MGEGGGGRVDFVEGKGEGGAPGEGLILIQDSSLLGRLSFFLQLHLLLQLHFLLQKSFPSVVSFLQHLSILQFSCSLSVVSFFSLFTFRSLLLSFCCHVGFSIFGDYTLSFFVRFV